MMVSHFIAYLYTHNFASSSIPAIFFFHKLKVFSDPCQDFMTQRVLLGCKMSAPSRDLRRPMLRACKCLFSYFEHYLLSNTF